MSAPSTLRLRKMRNGTSGERLRSCTATKPASRTTDRASTPTVWVEPQPASLPCTSP